MLLAHFGLSPGLAVFGTSTAFIPLRFFMYRSDALSSRSRPRAVSLSGRGGHYMRNTSKTVDGSICSSLPAPPNWCEGKRNPPDQPLVCSRTDSRASAKGGTQLESALASISCDVRDAGSVEILHQLEAGVLRPPGHSRIDQMLHEALGILSNICCQMVLSQGLYRELGDH